MSLNACPIDLIPEETGRGTRTIFPTGDWYMTIYDVITPIRANETNEHFADYSPPVISMASLPPAWLRRS